ncbi:MAG: ferredoxin domain-containing protein [Verrucomicrobiae bacterium]|nr:ferredoxin domain-containing protein [Verrucomicrobiae bacterium]
MAACSAAAVASRHYIDNRLMYSIGRAAIQLGLFNDKVKQALGVPLSVTGKNPFFDRKS